MVNGVEFVDPWHAMVSQEENKIRPPIKKKHSPSF